MIPSARILTTAAAWLLASLWLMLAGLAGAGVQLDESSGPLVKLRLKSVPNNGGLYYGELLIGRPAAPFKLLLCTVCNTTWIPAYAFRGYFEQVHDKTPPAAAAGRASNRSWVAYNDLYAELEVRLVEMQIGDARLGKVPVGVATDLLNPELLAQYAGVSGVLGLNGATTAEILFTNPVDNLFKLGLIKHNIVSLHLRDQPAGPSDGAAAGLLTFGGVDAGLYLGELRYVPMRPLAGRLDNLGWALHATEVRLDWPDAQEPRPQGVGTPGQPSDAAKLVARQRIERHRFNASEHQPALVFPDTSTPYFVGYKRHLDKYLIRFMGARRFGLAGNYAFDDCRLDNKPDFVFALEGGLAEIRLRPRDYLIADYEHAPNGRRYCLAAFMGAEANEWTLGTRFFRQYFTVFDYDLGRFGLARPRRSKKEPASGGGVE